MIRIVQLSDTHFGPDGHRSHGGLGYDTVAAFDAVLSHVEAEGLPDLFVVTGDLADRGHPEDYVTAREALSRCGRPVNLCAGNHDRQIPFEVGLSHAGLTMSRTMRIGPWLFVFADSNFDGREPGPGGRLVDREDRLEARGGFGPGERSWLDDVISASDAEHVFIWLHHPPAMPVDAFNVADFDAEVAGLLDDHRHVRGLGAGHVHTEAIVKISDRPVFVCPALTINLDFMAETLLPPGYRLYKFHDDGTVDSTCHLIDGDVWPRHPIPAVGMQFIRGEIGFDEMMSRLGGQSPSNPAGRA